MRPATLSRLATFTTSGRAAKRSMVALGTPQKPIGWNLTDIEQGVPLEPQSTEITPVHQFNSGGYDGASFNRITRTPSSSSLRNREKEERMWINCCTGLVIAMIICTVLYLLVYYSGGGSSSGYHSGYHSTSHVYHYGSSHNSEQGGWHSSSHGHVSHGHSSHGHGHGGHGGHHG